MTRYAGTVLRGLYGSWCLLGFVTVLLPTVALLAVLPGEARRRALAQRSAMLVLRLAGAAPEVDGLDRLPAGPCILVANHASYLDGMILTAVLPPRFAFVIKREMTRVPVAHLLLRRLGSQFLERNNGPKRSSDARRILREASLDQRSLAFFPEGTFQQQPGLRRFRSGAFQAALRSGKPLLPVVIRGSRQMLPAGRLLPAPARLSVSILPALAPDPVGETADKLALRCRKSMVSELDEPDLTVAKSIS